MKKILQYLAPYLSLPGFCQWSHRWWPWTAGFCLLLWIAGLVQSLFLSPVDYQQGEAVRMMYVHVPAAIWSLSVYSIMGIASLASLIWRTKLMDVLAQASAPIGLSFTVIALATGSIWGKPMWGTWWVWDARLTSELILLFFYMGYIALQKAAEDHRQASRLSAILAVIGLLDVPIVHYSVRWWNTLHQTSSFENISRPQIAASMLWPLLMMMAAFGLYYVTLLFLSMRTQIVTQHADRLWVKRLVQEQRC